jgi:hypothetical protein
VQGNIYKDNRFTYKLTKPESARTTTNTVEEQTKLAPVRKQLEYLGDTNHVFVKTAWGTFAKQLLCRCTILNVDSCIG